MSTPPSSPNPTIPFSSFESPSKGSETRYDTPLVTGNFKHIYPDREKLAEHLSWFTSIVKADIYEILTGSTAVLILGHLFDTDTSSLTPNDLDFGEVGRISRLTRGKPEEIIIHNTDGDSFKIDNCVLGEKVNYLAIRVEDLVFKILSPKSLLNKYTTNERENDEEKIKILRSVTSKTEEITFPINVRKGDVDIQIDSISERELDSEREPFYKRQRTSSAHHPYFFYFD
jgi:hypothetical protein